MLLETVTIYDLKSKVYSQPVHVSHVAAGVRAFGDAVNEKSSQYNKHPEDYIMFHIGTFDDQTGVLTPIPPVELAKALALHNPA